MFVGISPDSWSRWTHNKLNIFKCGMRSEVLGVKSCCRKPPESIRRIMRHYSFELLQSDWSSAVSSIRSWPTWASHSLKGSAFFDGMDWIMRNNCSVLATSVERRLPSAAFIFNCLQFVSSSLAPSSLRRFFRTAQYVLACRASGWSVSTPTTSTIEKNHSSDSVSQAVRIC